MTVQSESYSLRGGMDLVSPFLEVGRGSVIDSRNFEALPLGGYRRIAGYKALDGYVPPPGMMSTAQAVPGTGPVRAVFALNDSIYAIRDNAGATAGVLYRADSTTRWTAVALPRFMRFNSASIVPQPGQAVNGQTSGATAVVRKTVFSGGFIDQGNAYGLLIVDTIVGTFTPGENLQAGTTVNGKVGTAPALVTIPAGGVYSVIVKNFYGGASSSAAYGASGVGPAFEFDGTFYTPIENGIPQFPIRAIEHKSHLMLGYREGSVINSEIGDPLSYDVLGGAAEIAVGDEITELYPLTGGALLIGCKEKVDILYGDNSASWNRQPYTQHGVISHTAREIANQVVVLDTRGVQNLAATQAFGDFQSSSLSNRVNVQLLQFLTSTFQPYSVVSQNNSQYRIFWGRNGYYFTFNGSQLVGVMPVVFDHAVSCVWQGLTRAGIEQLLFGTEDGFVMLMDSTNFYNGAPITSRLQLPFAHFRSPTRRKSFKRAVFDAKVIGQATTIMGRHEFDLGNGQSSTFNDEPLSAGSNGFWGSSDWNEFRWASPNSTTAVLDVEGHGENLSISLMHAGVEDTRIAFYGVTIHYAPRRLTR